MPGNEEADAYLAALLDYSGAFYGVAIAKGIPAKDAANAVAHIERAARNLHRLATERTGAMTQHNEMPTTYELKDSYALPVLHGFADALGGCRVIVMQDTKAEHFSRMGFDDSELPNAMHLVLEPSELIIKLPPRGQLSQHDWHREVGRKAATHAHLRAGKPLVCMNSVFGIVKAVRITKDEAVLWVAFAEEAEGYTPPA